MATQATLDAVQKLYIAYLGRAADKAGLDFWANAIESGVSTLESVATGFTLTPEYSSIYGNLSSDALVEQIYQNTFGRASDAEGKAFWVSQLATGAVTADTIAFTMINIMGDVDKALVDQKVVASNTYTQTAGENYDVNAGKSVLTDINAGTETPAPTPTPTPTVTVITSTAERDEITLGAGTFKFVVEAGTPASPDYQAAVGTPEVGTPASSDYVPASPDYQPAVGTPGTASASAAINDGYDIIGGFNISTDKLDLPETTLLTGTFDTVATGNSLSITSNSNGIVQFGNTTGSTTIADKVSALLTAMGATKSTAAFVDSGNTYVVQGDGVAGAQASDILVELTGVSTALDLSTFIV